MNDFSVHRIIGRGGFGEVYGCRKADTGKMYAMKCLDKKRIKMKQGETLALNERIMLSLVSTGVSVLQCWWVLLDIVILSVCTIICKVIQTFELITEKYFFISIIFFGFTLHSLEIITIPLLKRSISIHFLLWVLSVNATWHSVSCRIIQKWLFSVLFQVDCPFIVCMTYAFHTPDKLCFILDLMNGGDLHYHLSQHGVFNEQEMRFYAAEVILGTVSLMDFIFFKI